MKKILLLVLLAAAPVTRDLAAQQSSSSNWAGGTNVLGTWRFAQLRLEQSDSGTTGSFDVPGLNALRLPVRGPRSSSDAVQFTISTPLGDFRFAGKIHDRILEGSVTTGDGTTSELHLLSTPALDTSLFRRYVGTYKVEDGSILLVTFRPFGQLGAVQFKTVDGNVSIARTFMLIPTDDSTFVTSGSIVRKLDANETIKFAMAGGANVSRTFRWTRPASSAMEGARADEFRQEWVVVQSHGIRLNGTLLTPLGPGPHPAVVSVGGSGPTTRDATIWRSRELVKAGLAVLVLDKRGTGDPSGQWNTATISELASDLRAGLEFMRQRKDIDPQRLGVHGHSQGGWVAMTELASDVTPKFAILTSSTPLSPQDQEAYRAAAQTRVAGQPEADALQAAELMKLKWNYAMTGAGWEEFKAASTAAQGKAWLSIVNPPGDQHSPLWADVKAFKGFEPMSYATKIRVPLLLLNGSDDNEVPTRQSQELWRAALKTAGNDSVAMVEIAGVGHGLFAKAVGQTTTIASEPGDRISAWLKQTGITR